MAMQESPKSLRTYFVVVGLLSGLSHVNQLTVPAPDVVRLFNYVGLAMAAGFLVIGAKLPTWLTSKTSAIEGFLWASLGVAVAASLWDWSAGVASLSTAISLGLSVVITVYLRTQLRRLAQLGAGPG
ncbi:MAG: hypothetical protein HY902_04530 [Deltaproteobacteria bacterium]|nr:hypothetical protein [Deltaproteobacteria bacterium]